MNAIIHTVGSPFAAFLRSVPKIVGQPSVYPECRRKNFIRRYFENIILRFRDGAVCQGYNALGLDIEGTGLSDFINVQVWLRYQRRLKQIKAIDSTVLLEDKYLFWIFLAAHGLKVVPVLGNKLGGGLFWNGRNVTVEKFIERLTDSKGFIVKEPSLMCGQSVRKIDIVDHRFYEKGKVIDISDMLQKYGEFIIQPIVGNVDRIGALNSSTLNTLRIATCLGKSGEVGLWDPGMIRIGRAGCVVDNFYQGGIGVGLTENGRLKKYGYSHDHNGLYVKVEEHPDSKIKFDGYSVPCYNEAVQLVKSAHLLFPKITTIGWDVAITADGPVLLEGNHDWDMEMLQVVHHQGCRKRFKEVYGGI